MLDEAFLAAARPYWHPVARGKDLDPGAVVAVTLLGEELVLWRTPGGEVGLVEDLCAHRGTRLSAGTVSDDGCIRCPYHSWEYDATGACQRIPQLPGGPIPSKARVVAAQVTEHAGLLWACLAPLGAEARPVPAFPEAEQPGWHSYAGEVMEWSCQSTRQIENFLDMAHFSVVHVDVFGNPDEMEVGAYNVDRSESGWQLTTQFDYPAVNPFEPPGPDGRRVPSPISFGYRVELPFAVHLGSTMMGTPYTLFTANQPVTASTCRVYWVMAMPEDVAFPDEMIELSEQAVFHADRRVVETQRPERLPLDLGAELHLGFDKLAVAYRRALADLGFPVAPVVRAPVSSQ